MKFIKKQILWLMMLAMAYMPVHAQANQLSYFEKVGNYLSSDAGISQVINFSGQASIAVGMAFFYLYLQQNTKDMIGNQTMQIYYPGDIKTKLADVAGLSGAKADIRDIISYLEKPKQYHKIGAKAPKGILLNGEPGNGKTLFAKAVAGEVNCPFISVAGSSFVQMYVGLGATRVRDLFSLAQQIAGQYGACIIFIDEIDALARKRSAAGAGSDREHDQTVAQLLECMDGLTRQAYPIIVLGATNRAELLDPAVVRPGRFDRKVEVTKPLLKDRVELIKIALQSVQHLKSIDIQRLSRITSGFSGAQLAGLINDAAVLAVADGRKFVEECDIELAFDHITLGREIEGMDQTAADKWETAIHEAGHAVGWLFGHCNKYIVHKVSITPRSHTLGVVWAAPLRESYLSAHDEMKARIIVSLCGRLAEEEFNMQLNGGAESDLQNAYNMAYDMVARYGMSDALYNISYSQRGQLPNDIATQVEREVKKIIDECTAIAKQLIASHKQDIEKIAKLLIQKGTVVGSEIYQLVDVPLPIA